jgi:hypothetical protein
MGGEKSHGRGNSRANVCEIGCARAMDNSNAIRSRFWADLRSLNARGQPMHAETQREDKGDDVDKQSPGLPNYEHKSSCEQLIHIWN